MILSTLDVNAEYEVLGLVKGSRMRARHLGQDLTAGLRKIIGGEVTEYAEMMEEARTEALQDMKREAESLGADGVIGLRFTTATVTGGAAEVIAYGTAIRFL